ncbi:MULTISPECIES: NAD(P)H-quinone oxidoreductase [Halomonas]|uniref:NAD(P)H-quinone oxidoreductase n=1 Tax=Halomonas TaxID=2745 RepID=UPI001C937737|nr:MULTISPECIES: NAD(P)H-quinone oxidoreductase [Halomonas]MBY6209853.1 NAD(P)H-quinone oxidoreductase [Halomonas sp. DP3Y7-2]MBY6230072.1 NAD(P)H-quinone oxidoreductase [Halomonas sp. DP3Y7-1]MCA0918113.1 NAD(P)H-quinone oxidoreductase [Halomonas denitrificans]
MYAIQPDGDQLRWQRSQDLAPPQGREVHIEVAWAGVNRADLMQRAGHYPPPEGASSVLGLEVSGRVAAVGPDVEQLRRGQPVCALLAGGGYAERVCVDERQVLPVPAGVDLREAAALPEVYATAWLNLFMEGALEPGERVLIHAAASGVGTAAIQLCREFDHPCFVTVGSDDKLAHCLALGAKSGVNRHHGSFVEAVKAFGEINVILDPVGASYLADNQRVLAADGRLVLIGLMGGRHAELDLGRMLMKRQRLIGSTLRAKSPQAKGKILDQLARHVWPRIERGDLIPQIDAQWPIQEVEAAHRHVDANANTGKVLLQVAEL